MEILPKYCTCCNKLYESENAFEYHIDICEPWQNELYLIRCEKADRALDEAWEKTNERKWS